ncbi:MAG: 3'-5' exonuclease [Bacteroidota bacterium]|nr:3'-5' exonuclease [Bacteroidota bacterium]
MIRDPIIYFSPSDLITPGRRLTYEGRMKGRYAVLDVETTSGDPCEGRVIELAVFAFDGQQERLQWDTLVDPHVPVPPFIRRLTGIDNHMLTNAPGFTEVARSLATITEDRIIVAHNVRYDMTALEHEFARTGLVFERPTLCTEKLSRQLIPKLSHYNLGSLCRFFGIPFIARHRATSDAEATALLLKRLIDGFGEDRILAQLKPAAVAMRA